MKRCEDIEYIKFKKNVYDYISSINEILHNYNLDTEEEYDEIIETMSQKCSKRFSEENIESGGHCDYEEVNPLSYASNVPRWHSIDLYNNTRTMIAHLTTVTNDYEKGYGAVVGFLPNNINKSPCFFLEKITDWNNSKHIYCKISPMKNPYNVWYERDI
jgi:hypothetical protein